MLLSVTKSAGPLRGQGWVVVWPTARCGYISLWTGCLSGQGLAGCSHPEVGALSKAPWLVCCVMLSVGGTIGVRGTWCVPWRPSHWAHWRLGHHQSGRAWPQGGRRYSRWPGKQQGSCREIPTGRDPQLQVEVAMWLGVSIWHWTVQSCTSGIWCKPGHHSVLPMKNCPA